MLCNFIFRIANLFVNLFFDSIIIKLFYITKAEAWKELFCVYFFGVYPMKTILNFALTIVKVTLSIIQKKLLFNHCTSMA